MPAAIETTYRLLFGKKKIKLAEIDKPYKIAGEDAWFVLIKAGEDACLIPIPIENGKKIPIENGDRIARRTGTREATGDVIIFTKEEINDKENQPLLSPLAINPLSILIGGRKNIIWIKTMPTESAKAAKKGIIFNAVAHLTHFIKG